jgi:TrpR-related protein YerC/YecD
MTEDKTLVWDNGAAQQFAQALAAIDNLETMMNFLRDVMTEKEIIELSSRLEAARMLQAGKTYTEIIRQTKLSSRTVARISDWMKNGCSGYAAALSQIHHMHISPVPAG